MKNPTDHIGNRICILLVRSTMPQPTANHLRANHYMFYSKTPLVLCS